eukprot:TRINITY_DN19295_c0_g1_i1.p1 TRINITY_DN19295_c0_g1~~TRINITY_DN19295_c0_g1_i1.p1  ORF type:complete len:403 (+),score=79.68 TRINITY_DN19295_c0_g1_i1:53-1210(+)
MLAASVVSAALTAVGDFSKFTEASRLDFNKPVLGDCPCSNKSLCEPITVTHEKEVFGFLKAGATNESFVNLDWNQVTTVAWDVDPDLICLAHSHGARVVASTPRFSLTMAENQTALTEWVNSVVTLVKGNFIDGVVFDYEWAIQIPDNVSRANYNTIVKSTTDALHASVPGSQTSVCVPYIPNHDSRYYDFKSLSEYSDLFYIMFYDTRSQIMEQCIASPNAAYPLATYSINEYVAAGIDPSKIILGMPWYGKDYTCINGTDPKAEFCKIPWQGPGWRGVTCSAIHNALELHFSDIMLMMANSTNGRQWNNYTRTPYFNYVADDGAVHQIWYDDAESLQSKYETVLNAGIRGCGPFQFLDLDYSTPTARAQAQGMWDALKVFTGK